MGVKLVLLRGLMHQDGAARFPPLA